MIEKKTSKKELPNNAKAIFFLRHNNDIDHITPVLYKWLSTEKIPTDIIITTKRSYLEDPRIKFLKDFKHVRIFHIKDLFKKYSMPNIFNHFYASYDTNIDRWIKRSKFVKKKIDKTIEKIAEKIFKGMEKGIVVFDWTTTYFVGKIVEKAKNKGYTTISLPHGDWPYDSMLMTLDDLNYDCLNGQKSQDIFDYVVVPNKICYPRYSHSLKEDKIKVLGCPRYSDEWMKIISKLTPSYDIESSKDKLKIVFFQRNTCYPIFWEEVVRTIKLILQFQNVYLIVKYHPRSANSKKLTNKLISLYPEVNQNVDRNLKFIYDSVNSGSLLKWADLVVDVGTSIAFGAIKEGKPVLMPEYLHANYSTVAHHIKSTELKCRDDLYDILEKFTKNKKTKVYTGKERKKFIKEVINVPDKYILERYTRFLKKCLDE